MMLRNSTAIRAGGTPAARICATRFRRRSRNSRTRSGAAGARWPRSTIIALRPWRKTSTYGFRLIGLTTALVTLLDLGLEPFAVRVKHYWLWNPTKLKFDWYGAPWINFFGWAVTTLLILAFATPSLINKKPAPQPPPDYGPLVVWLLINLLFATGAAVSHLWPALGLITLSSMVVTVFALRGGRW